ncbi:nxt3 [Symbiodinium microadriaticum]|nr:nxt3 [Symbiodinium microadriaticum]
MDAQRSDNNGVFLVVTGYITMAGQSRRQFVQSFFLACQTNQKAVPPAPVPTYTSHQAPIGTGSTPVQHSAPAPQEAPPAVKSPSDDMLSEAASASFREESEQPQEQAEPVYSGATEVEEDADATDFSVDAATVMSEPDYVNVSLNGAAQHVAPEPVAPVGPPKSFADLVKSWSPDAAATTATAPVAKRGKRSPPPAAAAATSTAEGAEKPAPRQSKGASTAVTSSSLFVNQLPEGTTAEDLQALFGEFGAIKGVNVNAKGFGFVDFQESASVGRTLARMGEAGPFAVNGSPIRVEERAAKAPGAGNKAGGRAGGRGTPAGRGGRTNGAGDKAAPRRDNTKREKPAAAPAAKK